MTRTYRPGALGAMMDEYERAAVELTNLLETVDAPRFVVEYPPEAEKCRSIQKIMRHVIRAAYGCANDIRAALNMPVTVTLPTSQGLAPLISRLIEDSSGRQALAF